MRQELGQIMVGGTADSAKQDKKPKVKEKLVPTETRWKRSTKALLFALGVHIPATPLGPKVAEFIQDSVEWIGAEGSREILRPQSKESQDEALARIKARAERVKNGGLEAKEAEYKADVRERLNRGEAVTVRELKFNLARLRGEDPGEVASAERNADKMIAGFAERMGDQLTEKFIGDVSTEMYGSADNYDWGQGSFVRYFNTGKRNCVAIADAQEIVFEGLIEKLPAEERQMWQLGKMKVKQHDIATIADLNGARSKTFVLEPPITSFFEQEVGTALITADMQIKGMSAEKPIKVKAKNDDSKIEDSPDLAIVTDQAVTDGVAIEGKLKGSDFVMAQAEKEGVKAELVSLAKDASREMKLAEMRDKTIEVGIATPKEMELTFEGLKREGVEEGKRVLNETLANLERYPHAVLDATKLKNPTPEAVKAMQPPSQGPGSEIKTVRVGDIAGWQPDAVRELLKSKYENLEIDLLEDGRLAENFLLEFEKLEQAGGISYKMLLITRSRNLKSEKINEKTLLNLLNVNHSIKHLFLDGDELADSKENLNVVLQFIWQSELKELTLVGRSVKSLTLDDLSLISQKIKVHIYPADYLQYLISDSRILDLNVDFKAGASTYGEITTLLKEIKGLAPQHRFVKELKNKLEELDAKRDAESGSVAIW